MSDLNIVAIIDDDESILAAMSGLIRSLDYHASSFQSAEDFLASDVVETAGCVITDIQMPGMDGFALQHRLCTLKPDLPVVMMTAIVADALEIRAMAAGVRNFFRKPVSGDRLAECLAAIFSAKMI